jgi:hypothetical protein
MDGTLEIVRIFLGPEALTGHFGGLAAVGFETMCLPLGITVIRGKEFFTAVALQFLDAFHDRNLQVNHQTSGTMRKEKD